MAVARGSVVIAADRRAMRHGHGEALMPLVEAAAARAGIAPQALDIVAVSLGPGSFTGVRVGLAAARGIALAAGARLVGVSSLAAVAALATRPHAPLVVALDSRRDDIYVQVFAPGGAPLADAAAILPDRLGDWLTPVIGTSAVTIAGDAAEAAATALSGERAVTAIPNSAADARGVLAALAKSDPRPLGADVAPLYLRPPDVSAPKRSVSVLRADP